MKSNRMKVNVWRTWAAMAVFAFVGLYGVAAFGENRYEIVPWTEGWTAAKADAEARGGHLATITSEAEWVTVSNQFGSSLLGCWLGATDEEEEGVWKWVTGEKWEYTNWNSGEPNNHDSSTGASENYLNIDGNLLWNDVQDTYYEITKYLLEYEDNTNTNITLTTTGWTFGKAGGSGAVGTAGSGEWKAQTGSSWIVLGKASGVAGEACTFSVGVNGSGTVREGSIVIEGNVLTVTQTAGELPVPESRYEIIAWTNGWTAAKADAEARGGHLATITSAEEWSTVTNLFGTDLMLCWLGGTDEEEEGVWKWVTGEKWEFSYWADDEPNNTFGSENYLHVSDQTSLVWNDLRNNDYVTFTITKYLLECDYNTNITLTATAGAFGKAGGSGSIGTAGSGEWKAQTGSSWIALGKASGVAGEACSYKVGENTSGKVREGTILIEGKVFTVTQTLEAYNTNITISTTGRTFDKAGGAASVLTGGSGEWSARTDVEWITLNRANGEAGVSCIYAVGANWTADTRMGHIFIEDKTYTVTQTGYAAGISPESAEWDCKGGSGIIAVTVDAGVAWTAVANAGWIAVSPASGRSSGTVTYTVAAYDEVTPRSGSVTVAGQTFTVTQSGTDVTLSPMSKTLDWRANAFEVTVRALSTTEWSPVPEASWLSVVDSGYGRGSSTILVAAGDNPSALTRTGTVAVGAKKITVTQTGTTDLRLELTPTEATASAVGAYGNIAVYATPDAEWSAAVTVEWITISEGASGAGNGNIKYIVMANPLLEERSGQIKVTLKPGTAGGTTQTATHTVTQGVIDPVVSPTEVSFGAAGGSARVQLTVAANTQWTAKSNNGWLKVTSANSSAGSATVAFDAAANPSTEPRSGSLTIAGKTVKVSQAGLWSQLVYDGKVFGTSSDSGFIDVQVEGDGTWTASTDAPWLTLMDAGGHGSGSVMFVVDDFNTAVASRTAVVTIAGKTVEITQRGYELSIDPAVADLASNAGAGEIGISAPIDALWEAIVTVDWIRLVGETTGLGNGTLRYTVADNTTGELRTGKIIISGQEYTVTQHANLTLTALVEGAGSVAGAGDYETNERVTLTATPDEGFAFTHWSGDAVGVEPQVTITMDMPKTVTAHFIPEVAAARLAEEKAAQGGFYTREQMKALAMGDTVIEVDPEDGRIDLAIQLQESADLSGGEWDGVEVGGSDLATDSDGVVHIKMAPKGNTAFYRLVKASEE